MQVVQLLPLAAFVALAALFAIVLRRAGRLVAKSREVEDLRATIRDLDQRIGLSLDGAAQRIDAVRRQQSAAEGLGDTIVATREAIERYTDEVRAIKGPPEAAAICHDLVHDLGRASRAVDMVEHGATILLAVRRRGRELEAQTSIKRGYLNLIHAREAIARHAARAQAIEASASPRRAWQVLVPDARDVRDDASNHTI